MLPLPDDRTLRRLLAAPKTIAVVGLSPKEMRPSNQVARALLAAGHRIVPVNPGQDAILGIACYPSLAAVDEALDIVDIFRRSEEILPVVMEAIAHGAVSMIWMQEGVRHSEAARLAMNAGITVVMDRCIETEMRRLFGDALQTKPAAT